MDHVGSVVPLASKFNAKVVAMVEVAGWVASKGVKSTIGFNKGGTVDLGFVKITMTHALHSSSIDDGGSTLYGGEAAGFILTFKDGRRAYFAGDTAVFSEMALYAELYRPELAFLPIGDHYTMGIDDAIRAADFVKCERVLGIHYDTFPPIRIDHEEARRKFAAAGKELILMEPGETRDL